MQIWKGLDSIFTFSPWLYNGYFPTLEVVGSVSLLRCSIFWGLDQIWSIGKCYQSRPATRLSNFQGNPINILCGRKSLNQIGKKKLNFQLLWQKCGCRELVQQRRIIGEEGEGGACSFFLVGIKFWFFTSQWLKHSSRVLNLFLKINPFPVQRRLNTIQGEERRGRWAIKGETSQELCFATKSSNYLNIIHNSITATQLGLSNLLLRAQDSFILKASILCVVSIYCNSLQAQWWWKIWVQLKWRWPRRWKMAKRWPRRWGERAKGWKSHQS